MQNMNDKVKNDSYVPSNIVPVRTPNNGNYNIDKNNQTLPGENDTQCNVNTNLSDVSETSGLRRSTKARKTPFYLNYV